ncbi:MAG TPA: ABC transporter substrate-binding protein [Xanthobacteraceae bacterium]|jgi:putative ABC transport system substrate-binding protein|nr:ABC transporter substrate-binding protein [Xanthobacteraceae bacterium]
MRRRDFIAMAGAALASPLAASAQEAGRTYRIGGLSVSPRNTSFLIPMTQYLREQGFVENQNLAVDWRQYGTQIELLPKLAQDLVDGRADVIYATGAVGIRAVQKVTATIPIVGITDDMVESGFVQSLAHPGGNVTGISILAPELNGKRQEILIEAVPGLRRLAALADANAAPGLAQLRDAARDRNVALSIHSITTAAEIPTAIDAAKAAGAEALVVLSSPILNGSRQVIMERVAVARLPAIYQFPEVAEEGGFLAYGPRLSQIYRDLLAPQIVKLLRGAKPAEVPVEQPTKFELVINLKTAKALGLTVSPSLLARADAVIE